MSNLFDFSDNQLNWRNSKDFRMDHLSVVSDSNQAGAEDEEDWFFPQPSIDVPDDISACYKKEPEPALPPIIYLSGMDLNCKNFEKAVNLADFDSWDQFVDAFSHKYIYISIIDADNCDFDKAQEVLSSEEIFDEIIDNYKACL